MIESYWKTIRKRYKSLENDRNQNKTIETIRKTIYKIETIRKLLEICISHYKTIEDHEKTIEDY